MKQHVCWQGTRGLVVSGLGPGLENNEKDTQETAPEAKGPAPKESTGISAPRAGGAGLQESTELSSWDHICSHRQSARI